jgi:hypothetical protein
MTTQQHWQNAVRQAPSEAALVAVVADFLHSLPAEDVERLPAYARPIAIRTAEDVAALNVQVAREELMFAGDARTAASLRLILTVLTEAANRLASMSIEARMLRPDP